MSLSASYASVNAAFWDCDGYVRLRWHLPWRRAILVWSVIVISPLEAMGQRMRYAMGLAMAWSVG